MINTRVSPRAKMPLVLVGCILLGEATVWIIAGAYCSIVSPMVWADNMGVKCLLVFTYGITCFITLHTLSGTSSRETAAKFAASALSRNAFVASSLVGGIVIYEVAYVSLGGLSARETVGNYLTSENSLYWLRSVEGYPILASMYIYSYLFHGNERVPRIQIVIFLSVVLAYAFMLLISGGRGGAIILLASIFLLEVMRSGLASLFKRRFTYITIFVASVLFYVIGEVRTYGQYESQSERLAVLMEERSATSDSTFDDAVDKTMFRLSELYGHVVINRCLLGEESMPFLHVDRLFYTLIPAVFAPQKLPLDDGPENLAMYFGFDSDITEFKSLPITLQADLFWRFGYLGPVIGGLIVGLLTVSWIRAVFRTRILMAQADVYLAYLAVHLLRLYPSSILGIIGILGYKVFRDVIIFNVILVALGAYGKKSGRLSPAGGLYLSRPKVAVGGQPVQTALPTQRVDSPITL